MPTRWPDLAVLELLTGIDDLGSLSAAARLVGMAQPNATRSIKKLERQLGLELLQRSPTGSVLTAPGTVIAHWARQALVDARRMLDMAEGLRAERAAELTVAASMTVAEHLMPGWLGHFRQSHRDVTIHLQVHNSTHVFERVDNGECDIGFVESPTVPSKFNRLTVARDRLVVVVHPTHSWARRKAISVAELAETRLLVREPGSGTRTTLDLALESHDRTAPLLELGSAAAIRTSVLAGVGPAVMSTLAVAEQVENGELVVVDVDGLELKRVLRAVWRGPRQLDGPAGELIHMIRRSSG
ncbi:LysR family transcriptional regulator [Rhodococcus sp. MEB064]|uniref:LysR family transcriptional regulator n=1 Tax=Rhodococcus sp. MEB064 TaxID=1587522 RepID=UPI0005ACAEB6|nr:LysR family transcriptional regulator [Rhodococcus sp. MEB064]KIQ08016.1 LysR family transcriptional regulator [Rhodococcus sp. MEB064]